MAEAKVFYLTNRWTTVIFVYYVILFFIGSYLALLALLPKFSPFKFTNDILTLSITGAIGMALNGSSTFYIRKLYKLCFSTQIVLESNSYIKRLGTIVYFFTRPLFSVGFAILIVIGLQSGFLITSKTFELNQGFVYLTMFTSFFAGFLSGKFVKKLEGFGGKIIDKVVN